MSVIQCVMTKSLKTPWISHYFLFCQIQHPTPLGWFYILPAAVCGKYFTGLAPPTGYFSAYNKFPPATLYKFILIQSTSMITSFTLKNHIEFFIQLILVKSVLLPSLHKYNAFFLSFLNLL